MADPSGWDRATITCDAGGPALVDDSTFGALMARLRDGDDDAATAIVGRFLRRLVALSSSQFEASIRHKADPEDVVQSAYKSFFARYGRGDFEFADWDGLWGMLAVITLRKCYRRRNYLLAGRRDAGRETSAPTTGGDPESRWEFIDRAPTPPEAAMFAETVEGLLEGLGRAERDIVELSLQGYTTPEIAARLGRSRRTVQRVRERLKAHLRRLQAEDSGEPGGVR